MGSPAGMASTNHLRSPPTSLGMIISAPLEFLLSFILKRSRAGLESKSKLSGVGDASSLCLRPMPPAANAPPEGGTAGSDLANEFGTRFAWTKKRRKRRRLVQEATLTCPAIKPDVMAWAEVAVEASAGMGDAFVIEPS